MESHCDLTLFKRAFKTDLKKQTKNCKNEISEDICSRLKIKIDIKKFPLDILH